MGTKWEYRTLVASRSVVGGTRLDPVWDYCAKSNNGTWTGWTEIFNNLSEQGWEIFSVVGLTETTSSQRVGTNSFRIFAKREKQAE